ncbi:MAG TPA: serine protease [Candidatus Paceibacterota bacterium]
MRDGRGIHIVIVAIIIALGLEAYLLTQLTGEFAKSIRVNSQENVRLYDQLLATNKKLSRLGELTRDLEQAVTGSQKSFDAYVTKAKQDTAIASAKSQLDKLTTDLRIVGIEQGSATVAGKWNGKVARLACQFGGYSQTGSGTLFSDSIKSQVFILTNKHVVTGTSGELANSCRVILPGNNNEIVVSKSGINLISNLDLANLALTPDSSLLANSAPVSSVCGYKAETGTKIIVMGYPVVGSADSVTVTEGIISGYDGGYYTTSAKVERGHSGGAVISVDKNCFLGVPTFVEYGSLESLARILDIRALSL